MKHPSSITVPVLIAALTLLVGVGSADGGEFVEISGRVDDSADKPVEGIKVSSFWVAEDGRWVTSKGGRTDAQGNFTLKEYVSTRGRSFMALDAKQEHGALATLDAESAAEPILLKLRPTTLVKGAFENTGLGDEIETTYVSFTVRPAGTLVAIYRGAPSLSLRLPRGDYEMRIGGVDCQRISKDITLTKDMPTFDLGRGTRLADDCVRDSLSNCLSDLTIRELLDPPEVD